MIMTSSHKSISIIYRNIFIYRLSMNLLYAFHYKNRFRQIISMIKPSDKRVLELCFGDIYIADFCRKTGRTWTGYDLNGGFVKYARSKGFEAREADISQLKELPKCDVCLMAGSLYHFSGALPALFKKIGRSSKRFILSEPVKNLTNAGGFLHWISNLLTNAGKGTENFRYNEKSLIKALEMERKASGFKYRIIPKGRDMLAEILW